jgi:hypothetical protein
LVPSRLIYIPSKLFVSGNPAATVNNIAAHEVLFRLGIASELIGAVILILLTLAFYRLFAEVDRNLAVQVVIFGGVMPALLYFVGVVNDFGTLMFVNGTNFLSVFEKPQHDALAMLFLTLRDHLPKLYGEFGFSPWERLSTNRASCRVFWACGWRWVALPTYRPELCRHLVAQLSRHGIHRFSACLLWRNGLYAMARH